MLGWKRQSKQSAFHLFTGSRLKHAYLLLLLFQKEMKDQRQEKKKSKH